MMRPILNSLVRRALYERCIRLVDTSIIDMEPGRIEIRGQAIQTFIGHLSFSEMIWLMLRGERLRQGAS